MIIPKFTTKPAGFKINFQYGIGYRGILEVDFLFYPCTFRYTDSSSDLCP